MEIVQCHIFNKQFALFKNLPFSPISPFTAPGPGFPEVPGKPFGPSSPLGPAGPIIPYSPGSPIVPFDPGSPGLSSFSFSFSSTNKTEINQQIDKSIMLC